MLTVLHADPKKITMTIITKNKIKDLHKDHRNSDLNINKDHDRDLKNIEQTALNGGLSKDHDSTQEPDLSCNKSQDLNSHSRNDNEKDHGYDLKNTEQTTLNGGLPKDHGSTQEPNLSCNKSHDLKSHSRKENEKDHDHDLKNIKQTALNGGLSKDHDSTQERDLPCNTSHDLGSQTSKDNSKDHTNDLTNSNKTALNQDLHHDPISVEMYEAQAKEILDLKRRNEVLVKSNHDLNCQLKEERKANKRLAKDLERARTTLSNVESLGHEFIIKVHNINKTQFTSLDRGFALNLLDGQISPLKNSLDFIIEIFTELNQSRVANIIESNIKPSKSEKSKADVHAPNAEDFDENQEEDDDDDDENFGAKGKSRKKVIVKGSAEKEFGHNVPEVGAIHKEIINTSNLGKGFVSHRKQIPYPDKPSTILDCILRHDYELSDVFTFINENAIHHFMPKTKVLPNQDQKDDSHKLCNVKYIKQANYVIEPANKTFKAFCKKCNKYEEFTIQDKSSTRIVSGKTYDLGEAFVIISSYKVKGVECEHECVMSLDEINTDKILYEAITPYGEEDRLHLPESDAKAKKDSRFNCEDESIRINSAKNNNQRSYRFSTACNHRASDIKKQAHVFKISGPTVFDPTISSLMPLFKGCHFNVAQMADLLEAHLLYSSASRYHKTSSLATAVDQIISRGHLNVISIAFSRAYLEGVCREIKEQILKISNVLRMDESPVSLANVMVDGGVLCKQGYLWCMGNASLSSNHMVYFEAHPYRNIESFLSFINYNDLPDNIKYIITDAYACYDKGIQTMGGTKRKHALCHAHCRRPLHKFLKELGVLKLYNKLLEESDSPYDFFQRLQDLAMPIEGKGKGKPSVNLDKHTVLLLCIYHIINQIFVNDEYVVRSCVEHDSEDFFSKLDAVRKEHSAHLVTVLNLLVEVYIAAKNNIRISKNKKCFFSNLIKNKATEFCLYWMNARHKLIEFINDPMVPLTNNDIERAFRFPAISKHSRLSLKSMDGFHSFANQMTILQNCVICGVNLRDYIYWLVDNVKTRINNLPHELIAEHEKKANELWDADKQIQLKRHATPKKFVGVERGKDGAQKESVDMYDPSNPLTALYDAISYEGLTPLDFKNTLMAS